MTGTEVRAIQFDVPRTGLDCSKQIERFESFDPALRSINYVKAVYGLKDAPRAWRKKLHQIFAQWMSCQQLRAEPELYCVRGSNQTSNNSNALAGATAHYEEQQGLGNSRGLLPHKYEPGRLKCLLSMHVGDIKGAAVRKTTDSLLAHLDEMVGPCKADCGNFLHTGIQHEHNPGVVYTHQYVYIGNITPIGFSMLASKDEDGLRDTLIHESYRSVLGAVAWAVITRVDLAMYVQALQRRARAPRIKDCERLSFAIRYVKRHKCGLTSIA